MSIKKSYAVWQDEELEQPQKLKNLPTVIFAADIIICRRETMIVKFKGMYHGCRYMPLQNGRMKILLHLKPEETISFSVSWQEVNYRKANLHPTASFEQASVALFH